MSSDVLTDEEISERKAVLKRQMGLGEAVGSAFRLAASTAAVGLPTVLVLGVGSAAGTVGMMRLADWGEALEQGTRDTITTGLMGVAGFCTVYALVQFTKSATVSRASWFPALFAVPAWFATLSFYMMGGEYARQMPPIVVQPLVSAWTLSWMSVAGAWAAVAWIRAGHDALTGRPSDPAGALKEAASRTLEVAAVHGGRVHAVSIGLQLIVPGILYALSLAFADHVAVLDPERRAMKRSGDLTMGMRSRVFRVFLALHGLQLVLWGALMVAIDGQAAVAASLVDFEAISDVGYLAGDLVWALISWLLSLAMLALYVEREGQVKAKAALRAHERAVSGQGEP